MSSETTTSTLASCIKSYADRCALDSPQRRDLERAAQRLRDLQAIVDRLPKSADGVPVVPGMDIWVWTDDGLMPDIAAPMSCYEFNEYITDEAYSTKESAQAAGKGE